MRTHRLRPEYGATFAGLTCAAGSPRASVAMSLARRLCCTRRNSMRTRGASPIRVRASSRGDVLGASTRRERSRRSRVLASARCSSSRRSAHTSDRWSMGVGGRVRIRLCDFAFRAACVGSEIRSRLKSGERSPDEGSRGVGEGARPRGVVRPSRGATLVLDVHGSRRHQRDAGRPVHGALGAWCRGHYRHLLPGQIAEDAGRVDEYLSGATSGKVVEMKRPAVG